MAFELDQALRWLKSQRRQRSLIRREHQHLAWVEDAALAGAPLLLDSTVYIDVLQGHSPVALDELIGLRVCNHSAVCIAELTHAFGRLNPSDPRSGSVLKRITQTIRSIPPHRIAVPDDAIWGAAGILAGCLFRLGSFASGAERKCLNDALVYLQARKLGCPLVTGNVRDFDFLNQLVPDGRVLFYRRHG